MTALLNLMFYSFFYETPQEEQLHRREQAELDAIKCELSAEMTSVERLGFARVATSCTPKELDKKIASYRKRIDREEKNRGKQEDILRDYYDKKARWDEVLKAVGNIKALLTKLDALFTKRQKAFLEFRKFIGLRASVRTPALSGSNILHADFNCNHLLTHLKHTCSTYLSSCCRKEGTTES